MLEILWKRIVENEGQTFKQIRGGNLEGNTIELSRTNRSVSRSTFKEALKHVPLDRTVSLQHLQAPSYLYAILMDSRIRKNDW